MIGEDAMYLKIITIFIIYHFVIFILFVSGCSLITHSRIAMPETDGKNWVEVPNKEKYLEYVQYKNNDVIFNISNGMVMGFRTLFWGPLFFPAIPNIFYYTNPSNFALFLKITNASKYLSIEPLSIILLDSGGQVIPVTEIVLSETDERFSGYCYSPCKNMIHPLVLCKGYYYLIFEYKDIGEQDELTIEFGNISKGGKQIKIPPLKLIKKDKFTFWPIIPSNWYLEF